MLAVVSTVEDDRVAEYDIAADPECLRRLGLALLPSQRDDHLG
ncbi:hypothetical protein [Actinoallomurus spadix]|nr:hypothetical protein [Actinoallomurus spadix]